MPLEPKEITLCENCLNAEPRDKKIVLSLTSIPQRINTVEKTIKTLLKQTIKPDVLILWLAKEQFSEKENELPQTLLELQQYGLTIKWCNDIRSYKKLIPALKEYPKDIIITFDDDIYYPENTVELLYNSYLKNPDCIHTNRGTRLYIKNNALYSVSKAAMYFANDKSISYWNIITGCGGTLYPPKSLHNDVFNEDIFREILPTQDDIWFWAMAVLNNTKIKLVSGFDIQLPTVENTQQYGLSKINNDRGAGMNALKAAKVIVDMYPEIFKIIKDDVKI